MIRLLPLLCLVMLLAPDDAEPLPVVDTTDSVIKGYTDGTSSAPYFVLLHEKPVAGQFWKTGSDSYEITSSTQWQITKVEGQVALVEQRLKMDAEMFKSDYVLGFRVKLDAGAGKPNVTKAWIGKPGQEATPVTVKQPPPEPDQPAKEPEPDPDETTEDFAALKLGGGSWAGKLYTRVYGKEISQVWIATEGWFGGVIKVTSGDYTNELQSFGSDGTSIMTWGEEVLEEVLKEDPAPEKPPDTPEEDAPDKDD